MAVAATSATVTTKPASKYVHVKLRGGGSREKFTPTRQGGSPKSNVSMTPERLQALARQRIVNYH